LRVEKTLEGLTLIGESQKTREGDFIVEGHLSGKVKVECIKCLEEFEKEIDEEIKIKIVKPPYDGFDENYDIIEMEKYDIDEFLKSEIESIRNDYNICPNCEEGEFNKEF
jgi:uncharacterized metal-binding protein YceD (DUF177 family)